MTRELLQQALEALENIQEVLADPSDLLSTDVDLVLHACTALRQALAQPEQEQEQEPEQEQVASIYITPDGKREFDDWRHDLPIGRSLLYTSPPQRQPLTDGEIWQLVNDCTIASDVHMIKFARAIEAKIKDLKA